MRCSVVRHAPGTSCIAAALSSIVRCVYWPETVALLRFARDKSETPAAFSIVTAV